MFLYGMERKQAKQSYERDAVLKIYKEVVRSGLPKIDRITQHCLVVSLRGLSLAAKRPPITSRYPCTWACNRLHLCLSLAKTSKKASHYQDQTMCYVPMLDQGDLSVTIFRPVTNVQSLVAVTSHRQSKNERSRLIWRMKSVRPHSQSVTE